MHLSLPPYPLTDKGLEWHSSLCSTFTEFEYFSQATFLSKLSFTISCESTLRDIILYRQYSEHVAPVIENRSYLERKTLYEFLYCENAALMIILLFPCPQTWQYCYWVRRPECSGLSCDTAGSAKKRGRREEEGESSDVGWQFVHSTTANSVKKWSVPRHEP